MEKRESFNSKWGFILACIGSAVGMGNLWMFPTRVSLYGGGSFLIPYFIFVALIGSTGVIGEMCLGRGTRSGPIDAFGAACETRGRRKLGDALGFIPAAGSLAMAIGYTVVMGWILKYAIGAFTGATLAPADKAGLKTGDRIVSIDGTEIAQKDDLGTLIQQHAAGDTLSITVAREGQMQTVSLTLGEKNAQTQQAQKNS